MKIIPCDYYLLHSVIYKHNLQTARENKNVSTTFYILFYSILYGFSGYEADADKDRK